MQGTAHTKLQQRLTLNEAALKRWQSRLTRAVNAINKLNRQRKSLLKMRMDYTQRQIDGPPVIVSDERPRGSIFISDLASPCGEKLATAAREAAEDQGIIPDFLDRRDPLIAERMTAARKRDEAAARKKMPLTGKAALAAIKSTRKKVKAL